MSRDVLRPRTALIGGDVLGRDKITTIHYHGVPAADAKSRSEAERPRRLRLTVHLAAFARTGAVGYFINATNLSEREIELTHVWLACNPEICIRLFNYADQGWDQLRWVVERLRDNPETRSAAITTFMPLTDTLYIPCVSLLDFWMPDRALELVVYAHSLDFGKKAYGNLIELAALQSLVAGQLEGPAGKLVIHV